MEIIKNNKTVSTLLAIIATAWAILPNLDHIESAPSKIMRMSEKTIAWWYDDEEWTGFFAEFPIYMEIQSTNLSDESIILDISSTNGEITGEIYTPNLCAVFPPGNHRRVKGKVFTSRAGSSAALQVFEYKDNKPILISSFKIQKNSTTLKFTPTGDTANFFPNKFELLKFQGDIEELNESLSMTNDPCTPYRAKVMEMFKDLKIKPD